MTYILMNGFLSSEADFRRKGYLVCQVVIKLHIEAGTKLLENFRERSRSYQVYSPTDLVMDVTQLCGLRQGSPIRSDRGDHNFRN